MGDEPLQHWFLTLDPREQAQVLHAKEYAEQHAAAGVPGHGQFLLIAKLARLLDEARYAPIQDKPTIRKVVRDDQGVWRDVITGVKVEVP